MNDPRIIALFFLAGWRVSAIARLFDLQKSTVDSRIVVEGRRVGAATYSGFIARADKYRALVEQEARQ